MRMNLSGLGAGTTPPEGVSLVTMSGGDNPCPSIKQLEGVIDPTDPCQQAAVRDLIGSTTVYAVPPVEVEGQWVPWFSNKTLVMIVGGIAVLSLLSGGGRRR